MCRRPNGARVHCGTPEQVIAVAGRLLHPAAKPAAGDFHPRHFGGLHVFFTTDQDQCLVVWRTRDPDGTEIVTVSATIWAAVTEGEIDGYDLSDRQRDWLEQLIETANAWTDELTLRGLNANTGGHPTRTGKLHVPVRTRRGVKWRTV
jgi:hypothetical protein